jgi:NAD(P)-dependent dehydrogenase (short-subunit alcohol dehydrogenase family)
VIAMQDGLANRVVMITGASGIAAATAAAAVAEGASVFIASLHEEECRALATALHGKGGACDYSAGDLTSEAAVATAVERAQGRFGRIDALFNVAGISGRRYGDGPVHECTTPGWDVTLDVNLKSLFLVSRRVLEVMLAQAPDEGGMRGSIVNTSSVLALAPRADHFATHAYAASKGAIIALTESMAAYYAPHKIRVNALAPGLVRTPMSARAQQDPAICELLKTRQPLVEGFIEATDVAQAALFLLSDRARSITGATLTVDAGWRVST